MGKLINILLNRDGVVYRFGRVVFNDVGDIYYNFGTKYAQKLNYHDSYHASNEVHQGRQRGDAGMVSQFIPPEQITAPIQFGSTIGRFEDFRQFNGAISRRDVLLSNPERVTHPVLGVYLEPARTLMVRRAYGYLPPLEAEVLAIHTRRLTPLLDVTVVHVSVASTFGGIIDFDRRFTSKTLKDYYKGVGGWALAAAPDFRISVEAHSGRLQDVPRPRE